MDAKTNNKKTVKIVLNVLLGIVIALIVLIAVMVVLSRDRGYFSFFGVAPVAVKSDSMAGDNLDSFNKGDLIFIKVLNDEQKQQLKVGDIVTFEDIIDGFKDLNSHRIVSITEGHTHVTTRGDNTTGNDMPVSMSVVIGKYTGKIPLLGNVILFAQSSTGFLVFVVIPSFIVLGYCVYIVMRNYNRYQMAKNEAYRGSIVSEVEAARQAELKMAEMQKRIEELQKLADSQQSGEDGD